MNQGLAQAQDAVQDLSTPRRTLQAFAGAAQEADFAQAAAAMDLQGLPPTVRGKLGVGLAQQLSAVFDQTLWPEPDRISDEPGGNPEDGASTELIGGIPLHNGMVSVQLARGTDGNWRVSTATVTAIPALYAYYGGAWVSTHLPRVFFTARFLRVALWQWLGLLLLALFSVFIGRASTRVVTYVARRLVSRTSAHWDDEIVGLAQTPGWMFVTLAAYGLLVRVLHLSVPAQAVVQQVLATAFMVLATWTALKLTAVVAAAVERRMMKGAPNGVSGLQTQVRLLRRVAEAIITIVGGALVLMQFEIVRTVGASLLASAGVAGIVIGLAAQRSISTLLAGIQLSLTQPIRLGDTVLIENEWGWVEEITLTYVVVRVWDLRRLVVPISYFLEKPFQNWTKVTPDIMGTVLIWADATVPVPQIRQELERFTRLHEKWDGKVVVLQVTDCNERAVCLRALVSSADAGSNWDLRCDVREALIAFLQNLDGGSHLPRTRLEGAASVLPSPAKTLAPSAPATSG